MKVEKKLVRYLALGDSYTVGESVSERDCFPNLLAAVLQKKQFEVATPTIIAKTGWTTDELLAEINVTNFDNNYNLVSLLIGVNNQYRGGSIATYEVEFEELLRKAILLANDRKESVFVLSIPDWAHTPFGQNSERDLQKISQEIDAFNAVNARISDAMAVTYFDITPITRAGLLEPTLIAADGLHPSAIAYSRWVASMGNKVADRLKYF